MASIRKELLLEARPEDVWAAVRDFGSPHEKLVPGVLVDSRLEPGARVVTFANGLVVRELLVELNDETRRLCWTARGGRATHHNASMQVYADGARTQFVWITDVLPDEIAPAISALVEAGAAAIRRKFERAR
jgi:polyketide cyclase/dehydrase/lipid transport protein